MFDCGLVYDQFEIFRAAGIVHGIFTRHGGVSTTPWATLNMSTSTGDSLEAVCENYRRALRVLGLREDRSATTWMVHGNAVCVVEPEALANFRRDRAPQADALVTRARGVSLSLRFADCLPVLLFDPVRGAVGLIHAGWRGVVNGVVQATVLTMQRAFGSRPADILAGIGPSIGPTQYQVGADVAGQIARASTCAAVRWDEQRHGWFADLWQAAAHQLRQVGVTEIEIAGVCTASHTSDWFSHRAEGERTGRFGAMIALQ
ncbi:MAG: peptidoglycan editing factor PgeF [Thermoflexales bacterium]|nr:peptidoglycan editing factor PgeF [Thermoflexales bacterium]